MPTAPGATLWLTGLPCAGKTTLALAAEARLREQGRWVLRLDGDELRGGLCRDLGFSAEDRAENVRRAAEVACLFGGAGGVTVVALISPYAADRAAARARHAERAVRFVEVHLATPPEVCEQRDPRGNWARARVGDLPGFTGVDDPYEPPPAPELSVGPEQTPDEAARELLEHLP